MAVIISEHTFPTRYQYEAPEGQSQNIRLRGLITPRPWDQADGKRTNPNPKQSGLGIKEQIEIQEGIQVNRNVVLLQDKDGIEMNTQNETCETS